MPIKVIILEHASWQSGLHIFMPCRNIYRLIIDSNSDSPSGIPPPLSFPVWHVLRKEDNNSNCYLRPLMQNNDTWNVSRPIYWMNEVFKPNRLDNKVSGRSSTGKKSSELVFFSFSNKCLRGLNEIFIATFRNERNFIIKCHSFNFSDKVSTFVSCFHTEDPLFNGIKKADSSVTIL